MDRTAARNSRVGLIFFSIYLLIYCGYVGIAAFAPAQLERTPVAGLNVAILYGLGLIVFALIFAVCYGWACRSPVAGTEETGGRVDGASGAATGRGA
jgi:uncharacterized membrane protein (DUF485 family)